MRTANLAIVFTDIKGFTERTSQQTLEQNEKLLQVHAALLTPVFKGLGGRVVKSIGDAFLVTFESPTNAVLAGVAVQDRLWQHNQTAPAAERLDVRVAVNVGEVRVEGGDVFGEPVNIASRVEGIAEAGEVYFTEAVYLAMNKAEVPSAEVGQFELKGIPGKVRVYKVPHAPYRIEAPAAPAGPEQPPYGNLGLARLESAAAGAELTHKAAQLTTDLGQKASKLLQGRKLPSPALLGAGAAVLLLVLGTWLVARGNAVERAIAEVADAPRAEREPKVEAARKLIAQEKDGARRAWYQGQLAEATDDASSVGYYKAAAKAGLGKAEAKLIALLSHPRCAMRAGAADAVADLKLARAKGALEDLAEDGGADDGEQVLIFGCNSKQAAAAALARLTAGAR